jgi:hypothetical protein
MVDGFSAELDRGSNGKEKHDQEAGAQSDSRDNDLPSVRGYRESGAASPGLFEAESGRGSLSSLSHQGGSAGWHQKSEGVEELRTLRQGVHADAQQEALSVQFGMPRHSWPHECGEALGQIWATEPDVGRVAQGVSSRVDRLTCLGNAVIPQIPEIIGRAITEVTSKHNPHQNKIKQQ